jgi:hypothetical protein
MPKLLLFFLSSCFACYSQNLTLNELQLLKTKDITSIEEYLSEKHWNLLSSQEETKGKPGTVIFAYNKSAESDSSESFLRCVYSKQTGIRVLNLQMHSQEKYNKYIAEIKAYGCNLIDSKIGADNVIKIYQGDAITFLINVKTKKTKTTTANIYHIFIMSNAEYDINYKSKHEAVPQIVDTSKGK